MSEDTISTFEGVVQQTIKQIKQIDQINTGKRLNRIYYSRKIVIAQNLFYFITKKIIPDIKPELFVEMQTKQKDLKIDYT